MLIISGNDGNYLVTIPAHERLGLWGGGGSEPVVVAVAVAVAAVSVVVVDDGGSGSSSIGRSRCWTTPANSDRWIHALPAPAAAGAAAGVGAGFEMDCIPDVAAVVTFQCILSGRSDAAKWGRRGPVHVIA